MKRKIAVLFLIVFCFACPSAGLAEKDFTVYYSGDPDSMKVAITIDDLYEPVNLRNMLDICLKYGVHVTFFTLGIVIKSENAALWQRIVDEGHEIGNHTYGHLRITGMTSQQLEHQLTLTQDALNAVLREPYTMRLFRPPFGDFDHRGYGSVENLGALGYPYLILWSVTLDDVLRNDTCVKGGSIVLFHTNWQDVQCMDGLIPKLLDAGYELVTVSELLGLDVSADGNADD
jgi:peptidoglycan-N-acetylglucosamine deacetylase